MQIPSGVERWDGRRGGKAGWSRGRPQFSAERQDYSLGAEEPRLVQEMGQRSKIEFGPSMLPPRRHKARRAQSSITMLEIMQPGERGAGLQTQLCLNPTRAPSTPIMGHGARTHGLAFWRLGMVN